jgi:sporulation protein YlmC with PRC-barrel domain
MPKTYFAWALVSAALVAMPAVAQKAPAPASQQPAASSSTSQPAASSASSTSQPTAATTAQTASAMNAWQGSKLIGLNVYNNSNEKIGDIKELMVDQSGKIDLVVIGVGGFLGMGAHDVAVKFADLKWVDQPVQSNTASNARPATTTTTTGAANRAPATTTTTTTSNAKRTYPDHAMLNATKDQLKAMPQFDYSK